MGRRQGKGGKGLETLEITCSHIPKGQWSRGILRQSMNCALGRKGSLVELNATCGGATGRVEIWRNKGGMGVLRAQGDRLNQAWSRKYVLFY